jgi:hypothetical protein
MTIRSRGFAIALFLVLSFNLTAHGTIHESKVECVTDTECAIAYQH